MKNGKTSTFVPPLTAIIAVVATAVALISAIYFTQVAPQWITFLTGILVAATLAAATRASRSEWVVMRRTAQLAAVKGKLEQETHLRKKADQAIAAEKSRLHLIDEVLPTMVALVDSEGICRYYNRAFLGWLHLQPAQVNGRHMRDILGVKVYQETANATRQALAGRTVHYERTQTMPGGVVYRLSVDHLPQLGENGKISGFYMLMQDITAPVDVQVSARTASAQAGDGDDAASAEGDTADQDLFVDSFAEQITGQKDAGRQIVTAIENDEFCLFCQLISPLTVNANEVEHYEILVRLLDEEESMMSPGAFFPLAEKLGLMPRLDRWVVQHVAEWVASRDKSAKPQDRSMFFINVAGATICDPGFPEFLQLTLSEYGIPSAALCFEISNTELTAKSAEVAEFARRVRQCGCRVALGGFGRDKVSFDLIRGFQVEFLKIDGSVILDILRDPVAHAKVAAISRVAKKIGVKTVAEFVESEEIIVSLKKIGIDFAQGFGISRPRPLTEAVK